MVKEDAIKAHQKKLEVLRNKVKERKQEVLDSIDLDALLANPKVYLDKLTKEFYKSNKGVLQEAVKLGNTLAEKMLKSNVKD